jgi:hypothetical protein
MVRSVGNEYKAGSHSLTNGPQAKNSGGLTFHLDSFEKRELQQHIVLIIGHFEVA